MDLGLQDKVIVVSGGASGIGEAITRGAIDEDAKVVIVTRVTEAVERFQEWADLQNIDYCIVPTELGDNRQCELAVESALRQYGRIDALVNNAGVNDGVGLETGTPAAFMASLQQNLVHYYTLAHYALPALKLSRGSIVNVSSKVALTGQGGTSAYAAAKGAQLALTREWAVELLPFGIRVNAVIPAEVMTPLYRAWIDKEKDPAAKLLQISRRIPLEHRFTTPAEIAAAVLFLLSPTQSAHTTGQHVFVDGGYVHLDRILT